MPDKGNKKNQASPAKYFTGKPPSQENIRLQTVFSFGCTGIDQGRAKVNYTSSAFFAYRLVNSNKGFITFCNPVAKIKTIAVSIGKKSL
ncbi:hypothetical protein [Thalassomonas haliotis]|uniref:Uncharacterized protein n=1 Tax=Thalassomonas haliotis TaxID=485448 RepID=A0ABY7VKD8_9GAMM|nr:hypothetical protein [Thalassomonas haliotis]WDE14210.1 hypothetical protein H3N35_12805 [Thalassomonas haliotis]